MKKDMTARYHGQDEEEAIAKIISYIGDDPYRDGLKDTPARVRRSWHELFKGYGVEPQEVMTVFPNEDCTEMIVVRDIEFYSTCEHHMIPFYGKAHIGYIPYKKIIGVSKLPRILEIYSRRLQIQERICTQVTSALMDHLDPLGCGCIIEARHLCMCARGISKQNSVMVTSSLKGSFKEAPVRSEFLSLIKE